MAEKIIRDPVHDVIAFNMDRPAEALLFRLINAAEFQRLRRIRQLGMAALAYPGADHSRYSHSLGVMQTARWILARLSTDSAIFDTDQLVCLTAALLHDLGHGPLSHLFERISGGTHEEATSRVLLDPDSEVHCILHDFDPALPARVADLLRCFPGRTLLSDIICSQLDADRFDYLLRDNLMTGSRYGDFDLQWLLHALTADTAGDRLAVTWKGVSAVEAYLQSRYHMYRNVYFHKVVRSAEGMVRLALQRARRLAVQDRLAWPPPEDAVHHALLGRAMSVAQFALLDDVSLLHCFKVWSDAEDAVLAGLCQGLLFRRLYKTIDLSDWPQERATAAVERVTAAIEKAGGDSNYDLFEDQPADTPYQGISAAGDADRQIMVIDAAGHVSPLSEQSPLPMALEKRLMFRRLHVSPQWIDLARQAIG